MSTEDKNKVYSEYLGHELNFFIMRRDPAYFAATVRPFVSSKMEKQFMDHYVLGSTIEVLKHSDDYQFQRLTCLEQCLVIKTLADRNQKEKALTLAKQMQLRMDDGKAKDQSVVN